MTSISSAFEIFKGNHLSPKFTYKLNGVAQDIHLAELTFAVTNSKLDTTVLFTRKNQNAGASDDSEISWVSDGLDGEFYVHFIPTNTSNLEIINPKGDKFWWEIKMILDGKTTTIGQNELTIIETIIS